MDGISWYGLVVHVIGWSCITLDGIGYYSTMFYGIAWYCLVLYVIQGPTGTRYPKYFQYPINCQNHWVFRVSGIRENQVFDMTHVRFFNIGHHL